MDDLKIGTHVVINTTSIPKFCIGMKGIITESHYESDRGYSVTFIDGDTYWFSKNEISLIDLSIFNELGD